MNLTIIDHVLVFGFFFFHSVIYKTNVSFCFFRVFWIKPCVYDDVDDGVELAV